MVKKKDKKDKKLHNSTEPDLSWQESINLLPEDEVEGGSEIYYFTDEDGNVHSREFFAEELVPSDDEDLKDLRKRKPSYEKVERLKPGTLDIVGLSRSPQQPKQQEVVNPYPSQERVPSIFEYPAK